MANKQSEAGKNAASQYIDPMLNPAGLLRSLARQVPACCAVCHAWPAQVLCDDCVSRYAAPVPRCATCALPLTGSSTAALTCPDCLRNPPPLDACLAAVDYAWPWTDCITQFKFGGQPGWAAPLAQLLHSMPGVEAALTQADCVLPMPLSRQRLAERGYNQALLLARQLAPQRTQAALLLRIRHTAAQSSLHRAERLLNLQHAFAIEPQRAASLRGQRVVLIDDVMTTGTTLHAAAHVLRQAGAAHITALVLARTG